MAYFSAWEVSRNQYTFEERYNLLAQARQYLTSLKSLVDKEIWVPKHPEYFHTEAYILYQEYLADSAREMPKEYLRRKLEQAKSDISIALELYKQEPHYWHLSEAIENNLRTLLA